MFLYKNCIYYIWQRAIKRAADESGAFKNVSEEDLAQYVGDTAKLFADQVLAEAQMRNAPIDTVLKASDIVYEDGAIKLNVRNEESASGDETMYQLPQNAYDAQGKADVNSQAFKRWFGDSKVVDENGKVLELYHISKSYFDTFDISKAGKNTDDNLKLKGFWFGNAENSNVTENLYSNGGNIHIEKIPVYIKMENPYIVDNLNEF